MTLSLDMFLFDTFALNLSKENFTAKQLLVSYPGVVRAYPGQAMPLAQFGLGLVAYVSCPPGCNKAYFCSENYKKKMHMYVMTNTCSVIWLCLHVIF